MDDLTTLRNKYKYELWILPTHGAWILDVDEIMENFKISFEKSEDYSAVFFFDNDALYTLLSDSYYSDKKIISLEKILVGT